MANESKSGHTGLIMQFAILSTWFRRPFILLLQALDGCDELLQKRQRLVAFADTLIVLFAPTVLTFVVIFIVLFVSFNTNHKTGKIVFNFSPVCKKLKTFSYNNKWYQQNKPSRKSITMSANSQIQEQDIRPCPLMRSNAYREEPPTDVEFVLPTGQVQMGQMTHGIIYWNGECVYADGAVYYGQWSNGQRSGTGMMTAANGDMYCGDWQNDQKYGTGQMNYADGSIYNGFWSDDCMDGVGQMNYADGQVYYGEWENNKKHGRGEMKYVGGSIYQGRWENDKKHGKGKVTEANGLVYDGNWTEDLIQV